MATAANRSRTMGLAWGLRGIGLLAFAGVIAVSQPATAEPARAGSGSSEPMTARAARALFYKALDLQDRGKWKEALTILEEVGRYLETAQVRFNIAFCQEHLGKFPQAAGGYERAILLAQKSGAAHVTRAAQKRLAAIEPRVARLIVRTNAEDATVTVDGASIKRSTSGEAVPVAPGEHTIEVSGARYQSARTTVTVEAGKRREVALELAAIPETTPTGAEPGAERVASHPAGEAPRSVASSGKAEKKANANEHSPSVVPYVMAGTGALALAASGVFYVLRERELDRLDERCDPGFKNCPEDLRETNDRGKTYTTLTNVTFFTGVGLVGVGAGIFVADRSSSRSEKPKSKRTGLEISVSGRF